MTTPIPAGGYPSNTSRTQSDMQTYEETILSIIKELIGATSEAASVQLSSNTFTPGNNACVFVIDTNGLGPTDTLNTIQITNVRDGQVIYIRSTNNSRVITVANAASGTGQIYTFDSNNITLNSTKIFIALKYNASIGAFEELFRTNVGGGSVNWGAPGAIGATAPNTGAFTSISVTGNVGPHTWFGNSSGSSAVPSFSGITSGDLPPTAVTNSGNLSPLFTTSISSQSLSFSLSNANAGTLLGNFSGSSGAPSYHAPGSADQVLGVAHTGGGLEYKSIVAGSNITVTAAAGSITIAASGGASGTVTSFSAGSASPFFTTSVATATTTPALTFSITSQNANTVCAGPSSGGAAAPTFRSLASGDLPSTAVNSSGNLSPIFTSSISSQALSFALSNAAAGTLLGNFAGSPGAPSYNAPGAADQLLGVAHTGGGLEYKTISAGAGITVTPSAGTLQIAATGSGGLTGGGNLSPIFTTSVSGSTLTFSLSNASALSWFGNASGLTGAPSYNTTPFPPALIPADIVAYTYFGGL